MLPSSMPLPMTYNSNDLTAEIHRLGSACKWQSHSLELLLYLAKHSVPNEPQERSAAKLAGVLKCQIGDVPKYIQRLHEDLIEHYHERPHRFQVIVHHGGQGAFKLANNYLVELVDLREYPSSRKFWGHHLDHGAMPIVVATSAPLFFRHVDGTYRVRAMDVNSSAERDRHVKESRSPDLSDCEECFHYLSTGDFRLCIELVKLFAREKANVETRIVVRDRNLVDPYNPYDTVDLPATSSLIAIGNPRVSWVVEEIQKRISPNFYLMSGSSPVVKNRRPRDGERDEYKDVLSANGELFAILIRESAPERTRTLVLVQNGPALEALATTLTDEDSLALILSDPRWRGRELPSYFECVFRVPLGEREFPNRASRPELVALRTRP